MQLGITGTEADCPAARDTSRQTTLGFTCDDFTAEKSNCAAGQTYNTEKAASCKDIVAKLTCEEWLADSTPGDCNMICQ